MSPEERAATIAFLGKIMIGLVMLAILAWIGYGIYEIATTALAMAA